MSDSYTDFTEDQWAFLAVLEAFSEPVTIEIAGILAPLLPGPLIDLLEISEKRGLIKKTGNKQLTIDNRIPAKARRKLKKVNNNKHLDTLIDKIQNNDLRKKIPPQSMINLMYRAGHVKEAAEFEIEMAQEAIESNNNEKGRMLLQHAVSRLDDVVNDLETKTRFVASVLQLSNISFALGKGFIEIDQILHKAHEVSSQLGDKRSHALINLHLGRLYYFTDRRENAMVALSIGAEEIEELDDSDIRIQAAPFLGIYLFLRGHFEQALEHFEIAEPMFKIGEDSISENSIAPIFFGYCAIYLGKFHRAIGRLDYTYRLALERSDKAMASTIQAILGTVLVLLKKPQEASYHLNRASEVAKETNNALGLYFCGGGIALRYFLAGRMDKAYQILKQTIQEGYRAGLVRQFSSPWILEMLHEFHCLGYSPLPRFEYANVISDIFEGVNIHLQGVAFRLRAKEKQLHGDHLSTMAQDLDQSVKCLRESGDPVQLSKTLLEVARLQHSQGNQLESRQLAQEARHCLGGYIQEFFPVENQYLLETGGGQMEKIDPDEKLIDNFLAMIESLYPSVSRSEILTKVLIETSRMFGAERSALFWFSPDKPKSLPELRTVFNISQKEITTDNFKQSLDAIRKTYTQKAPLSDQLQIHETLLGKKITRSILCIPIEVQNRVRGVLYYDNSYLENAFKFLDLTMIKRMARHTNLVVERRFNHLEAIKQVEALSSEKSLRLKNQKNVIITRAPKMIKMLEQIDKIAGTDSTVLIEGETGTGKELLANRIYKSSQRAEGPFIVVDSTSIPESLLESELFGYEKGAFTGADKRKIGCIEMAHQGTLFLDEVGELALQAQSKLLRALQEKMIRRVGGVQTIESNFRLVAATNRELAQEVAKGRFREDLFYRLNVISLTLPPLRDRSEDSIYLVKHFIEFYSKKYNQRNFQLSADQKAAIKRYAWPGNIRELKNKVESAVILSGTDRLELELPSGKPMISQDPFADKPTLNEIQRRYIRHVIEHTNGRISGQGGAIDILGMKRTSLYARMKALGMKR